MRFYLIIGFLFYSFLIYAYEGVKPMYTIKNIGSVDNYSTFIDSKGIVWIYSENGVFKYSFDNPIHFTIKNGLYRNDVWGLNEDSRHRIWLNYRGKGLRYIKNNKVLSVPQAEYLSELLYSGERKDTVFFYCYDRNDQGFLGRRYYLTKNNVFGKCKDLKDFIEITSYETGVTKLVSKKGKLFSMYGDNVVPLNLKEKHLLYGYPDPRRFDQILIPYSSDASKIDSIIVFQDGVIKVLNIEKHLGFKVKSIQYFNSSKMMMVDDGAKLLFYRDFYHKLRDNQFEEALNLFYFDYALNVRINRDFSGNIWVNPIRGEINFIPNVFLGMKQYYYTDYENGSVMKIAHLSHFENIVAYSTLNREVGYFDLATKEIKTHTFFEHVTDVKSAYGVTVFNTPSMFFILNRSRKIKKFPKKTAVETRSFDWLNKEELLLSDGSVFNLKKGEINTRIFKAKRNYSYIQINKGYAVAIGLTWVDIYSLKTGERIHKRDNLIVRRTVKLKEKVVVFYEAGGLSFIGSDGGVGPVKARNVTFLDAVLYKNIVYFIDNERIRFVHYQQLEKFESASKEVLLNLDKLGIQARKIVATNSNLYIGTTLGLIELDISYLIDFKKKKPKVEFESIHSEKYELNVHSTSHELNYDDNFLQVRLVNYDYSNFGKVSYKYRLKGLNSKWISSKSGEFSFNNIPSGKYILEVKAEGLNYNNSIVRFPFSVSLPYWMTWWFIVIVLVLLVIILYLTVNQLYRLRNRYLQRKNALLELEFKALKSQLNPHFVFNSLNTLQSILFSKDELVTNEYIVSLSKLMRTVLDNSRVDKVTLYDEIEFIRSYVMIHAVKLDTKLDLVITTENIQELKKIAVRTMILQPFVENSIVHGLTKLSGDKRMNIHFKREGEYVFVTIEDNGIGRENAKKEKNISNTYQSVGTSILLEKSILVKQMYKEELDYNYADIIEDDKIKGTRVTVKMKVFSVID